MNKDHTGPILNAYKPKPPGTGRSAKRAVALLVVAALAGVALWLYLGRSAEKPLTGWTDAVATSGSIQEIVQVSGSIEMPVRRTVLSPEEGTLAQRILVAGEWVEQSAVIARIDSPTLETSLEDTLASIQSSERELAGLDLDRSYALEREAIDMVRKRRAIADAETNLATTREFEASGSGTPKETADKERVLLEAREALALADISYRESAQSYALKRATLVDKIAGLRATSQELKDRLASLTIRSPIQGRILSWKVDEGDRVTRYGVLATIADTSKPEAQFAVAEASAARLSPGMPVSIAVGTASYPGTINNIGRETTASSDLGSTVSVLAVFTGDIPEFTTGATASGEIVLGTKEDAILLPRGPYLTSSGGRYVYVVEGSKAIRRAATFGITRGSMVEVAAGVKAGETIIISDYGPFGGRDEVLLGGKR